MRLATRVGIAVALVAIVLFLGFADIGWRSGVRSLVRAPFNEPPFGMWVS